MMTAAAIDQMAFQISNVPTQALQPVAVQRIKGRERLLIQPAESGAHSAALAAAEVEALYNEGLVDTAGTSASGEAAQSAQMNTFLTAAPSLKTATLGVGHQ